jgi:hypothetical protein
VAFHLLAKDMRGSHLVVALAAFCLALAAMTWAPRREVAGPTVLWTEVCEPCGCLARKGECGGWAEAKSMQESDARCANWQDTVLDKMSMVF